MLALALPDHLLAYTKVGKIYTTSGLQSDVNAAISNASAGDTVMIPAGTFSWGAGGLGTSLDKAVTLQGVSRDVTIINQTTDSNGLIYVSAGVVKSFTVNKS